jgi:murein tripeptide amidase MpaA
MSMELISRPDGLHHLLLSDVNNLLLSIQHDFPEIAKVYSIGKSFEGRDINVIEMTMPSDQSLAQKSPEAKPAILMTGATHARELISTNLNVF